MIEWCKARARAQHWVEEVVMLWRELQSFTQACEDGTLEWDLRAAKAEGSLWFDLIASSNPRVALADYSDDPTLATGLEAYALRQVHARRKRRCKARAIRGRRRTLLEDSLGERLAMGCKPAIMSKYGAYFCGARCCAY